jgi:alanyl aminopeptidase
MITTHDPRPGATMHRLFSHFDALMKRVALTFAICLYALSPLTFAAIGDNMPTPPQMRLGDAVKPLAYHADLTIVPTKDRFNGKLVIDIEVMQAQKLFWLNATNLDVKSASLSLDGKTLHAKLIKTKQDFIGLQFAAPLALGQGRLTLLYSGEFSHKNTRGLFKQKDGANWYVYSQFEDTFARRAFPCFDEPQWKTPWTLALTVKRDQVAVSNTPIASETKVGTDMKRVQFATTKPLPSYLIALGVGPFDVVDGGVAGRNNTKLRYLTPKGRGAEAAYAAKVTPQILTILEDYFGRPYPFEKLDSLAIPVTVNFGAMENVGLITYRSNRLLIPPGRDDINAQQGYVGIAAHEMAHQWFGDLVTMAWWNDLWLNESFATWMALKTVAKFNPDWDIHGQAMGQHSKAMGVDRLASTRQIRQRVASNDDLANAFDGITYAKGASVLRMFESWLGEERFRDGVRRYLKQHEYSNATAEDFFAAISDKDPEVAKAFASFVEQPGVPLISMQLDCSSKPTLTLRQQRFEPSGKSGAAAAQSWDVPVCVRYEGQSTVPPMCTMLHAKEATIVLPEVTACPSWLLANPSGAGYYLSGVDAALLPKKDLTNNEVVALSAELSLLALSGAIPVEQLLGFAAQYADDARPEVAKAAVEALKVLHPAWLDAAGRAQRAVWIDRHFGQRAQRMGWQEQAGESDAEKKLRAELLPLVAEVGGDPVLLLKARGLALEWLAQAGKPGKPGAQSELGGMLGQILKAAAYGGDQMVFDAFIAAAAKTHSNSDRDEILGALGAVADPALREQAFGLVLSPRFDARESVEVFSTASERPDNGPAAQQFIRAHYAAIVARLPDNYGASLARLGHGLCTKPERDAFQGFFSARVLKIPGGARNMAQALEDIDICVATGQAREAGVREYFAKQPAAGAPHAGGSDGRAPG